MCLRGAYGPALGKVTERKKKKEQNTMRSSVSEYAPKKESNSDSWAELHLRGLL